MTSFPFVAASVYNDAGVIIGYDRNTKTAQQRGLNKLQYTQGIDAKNPNAFLVLENTGMTVNVTGSTGADITEQAWAHLDGVMAVEEATVRTLTLEAADTLDRIDRIVLRKNDADADRDADLYILKGTPADVPVAAELTQNTTVWEIAIADVFVPKDSTSVSQSRITDQRMNGDVCGLMTIYFDNPDMQPYFAQISALIADYQTATTQSLADLQSAIDSILAGSSTMLTEVYDPNGDGINTTVQTYTHTYADGVHTLTGSGDNGKFTATAVVSTGDTFAVNATTYTAKTDATDGAAFIVGNWHKFTLDTENLVIYFTSTSVGVANPSDSVAQFRNMVIVAADTTIDSVDVPDGTIIAVLGG